MNRQGEPGGSHWGEEPWGRAQAADWPLDWRCLDAVDRWFWFERLWISVCLLRDRYQLPVRNGWWGNPIALEALAALTDWVERFDTGCWDDPQSKLALLHDLERVSQLLRDGNEPFHPDRDRLAFTAHMISIGCEPPDPAIAKAGPDAVDPEPPDRRNETWRCPGNPHGPIVPIAPTLRFMTASATLSCRSITFLNMESGVIWLTS